MSEARWLRARIDRRDVLVSPHAIARYQERVKPALDPGQCAADLRRLLPLCTFSWERPSWASKRHDQTPVEWVLLGDAIAFVVEGDRVLTCVTRSAVGAEVRVVRADERQQDWDRNARPGRRQKHGKVARQQRAARNAQRDAERGF